MDLIHLCLEGIRQEQEQEFPRPAVRFFSNLVDESPTILFFFFGRKGIYILKLTSNQNIRTKPVYRPATNISLQNSKQVHRWTRKKRKIILKGCA